MSKGDALLAGEDLVLAHHDRAVVHGVSLGLRAGTVIEVFAGKPGTVGKYTRFRRPRARAPARVDSCFVAGAGKPSPCPDS